MSNNILGKSYIRLFIVYILLDFILCCFIKLNLIFYVFKMI